MNDTDIITNGTGSKISFDVSGFLNPEIAPMRRVSARHATKRRRRSPGPICANMVPESFPTVSIKRRM
jgi:hypothetical protein